MPLKYVFHLSDIHIRNGDNINSRYEEYNNVINNTIISINEQINIMKLKFDDFIIVISGDIFHNRYNASNFGLLLFNHLIKSLTKIGRLIIFEGNHERLIDNNPSLITSLNFDINNLTVLNESQTLIIDEIGFSYLSLFDTMNSTKLTGRKDILPEFPKIIEDVKYKIALFHGTFISCKLFNGDIIKDDENSTYPLELIEDFDYAILGDVHKRQVFNYKNKVIGGYSSSLIQQNFGEDLIEHGYLIWDLYNKKIKEINVCNDIGYINIKENANGEILIRKNGKYECLLEEEINNNIIFFPKKLEIKIFSKINFNNLNNLLKKYNIIYNIFSRIDEKNLLSLSNIDNNNDITDLNDEITINNIYNIDNNYLLTYFKKLLTDYKYNKLIEIIKNKDLLLFEKNKYPDDLFNEIIKRNKELSLVIQSCVKNDDTKQIRPSFLIKYLEWESLLCYENKNWLNMHELDSKSFMVKGKNGSGKSAIYDILLLSIWGENTKSSSFSGGIINHNKNSAYTIIDIELDGILYRIKRDYTKREDKTKVHLKYSYLYKFQNDKDLELLKKNNDCNTEIKKIFGTIDDFLNSSMITQNNDNDILKLDAKKTLEIIDKSYNVDYIYNLYNLFKTAINKYRDFKRIVESKKEVYEKLVSNNKIDEITDDEIINLNDILKLKLEENEELMKKYNDYNNIDINNPKTLIILETDYLSLIKSLDLNKLLCEDDYNKYKEKYNELKYILKDEKDLLKLKNSYTENIENTITDIIIKPCELSILEREEKQLKKYLDDNNKYNNININELELSLKTLKDSYHILETNEKELITIRPIKINNPLLCYDDIINEIVKIHNSEDNLNKYILENVNLNVCIDLINDNNKNISLTDYNNYKKRYNELKYILKDINIILENDYNYNLDENKIKNIKINNKPCELSILEKEEKELNKYLTDTKFKTYENIDIIELENTITILKDEYKILELEEKELISNKPLKQKKPTIKKDKVLSEIKLLYNNNNDFKDFILSLNIIKSNKTIKTNDNLLTYDEYNKLLIDINNLEEIIKNSKDKLLILEKDFNIIFTKQQNKTIINKPLDEFKQVKYKTSTTINKELKTIDIKSLLLNIENDDKIINSNNIIIKNIENINNELEDYKKELLLLTSNDDYKYNPDCMYCCKRHWVCRIKELEIIINKLVNDKETIELLVDINDYNKINERNIKNKEIKNRYDLLIEWYNYYKSKEDYELITKQLNTIISDKTELNNNIILNETKLKENNNIINSYKNRCYELYENLIKIEQYEEYKLWDDKYNDIIKKLYELKNNINNHNEIINYNKNIKPRIDKYLELKIMYNEWLEYDNILKRLQTYELLQITELINNYEYYNNKSYELYNKLIIIKQYDEYKKWENNYDDIIINLKTLRNEIMNIEEMINYYNNIKPRIDKYLELKDNYNKWIEYDNIIKIINTNELFKINELLDIYDKYNEYNINNNKKPFIKIKLELNDKIKIKEKEIKELNDKLIKQSTINGYNKENRDNYERLYNIIIELDNTIDILETIIINFQAFRIEMYDKYVLNKLTERANKIIKTLCHTETKPFKLDYIITVVKDIIHINWLINNDYNNGLERKENENTKQIISINQASGYQQFVISMALRMSLFMNKYEIRCNQLFIDEGFINFDKYNLSIVPSFIKSLLSYFNNIIIVSHIDLIQDNIDEKVEIKYNKLTLISSIEYNENKKTIIKRNRNKKDD
jgi:DNA repair exonuclease SbcCD ATPase subunit